MLVALIALLVFAAVVLAVIGLFWRTPSVIEARIQDFRSRVAIMGEDEVDLSAPFADRVIKPGLEGLARLAASVLPQSVLANIEKQLVTAGSPMTLNGFVVMWVISIASFLMVGLLMVLATGGLGLQQLLLLVIFGGIGWTIPNTWLRGRVRARQKQIIKALPDALDLVTTCVEAGLGLDAALARVAEKSSGPLADELSRMLREVAMGKLRREALLEMAERVGVEELRSFVNSVIQAEQLGVGIAQVLRVQAEQMRTRRRQRAEQAAHEAPIKMIFPLVLFIFPAFVLVILGPAVLRISEALFR